MCVCAGSRGTAATLFRGVPEDGPTLGRFSTGPSIRSGGALSIYAVRDNGIHTGMARYIDTHFRSDCRRPLMCLCLLLVVGRRSSVVGGGGGGGSNSGGGVCISIGISISTGSGSGSVGDR